MRSTLELIRSLSLVTILAGSGFAQERLIISGVSQSPDAEVGIAILEEAYRRIGMEMEVRYYGGGAALEASNSGQTDGELQRIDGIGRNWPNLVQVEIPINYLEGAAFSKKYDFPVQGWFSLSPYTVGIVSGVLFAEQGTQGMDVRATDDYESLMAMLEAEEIDVAVLPRINGQVALKSSDSRDMKEMEGILEILFLYHYLHRRNAHLVPRLEEELKSMLLDGTTRRIREQVYGEILGGN